MKNCIVAFLISLCCVGPLGAQQRDSRTRLYLPPTRIVWQQEAELMSNVEQLLKPGNGQADLTNLSITTLRSTANRHPSLLLDFGKELQGGLQIVTGMPVSHEPVAVRIRLGESVSEAMCEIDGQNGATNDHALRDFVIRVPWLGVQEVGNSGFRFVRIDLLDDSVELHLKEIRAISTFRDIPYKGSFRCDDERLNQIWQTGAYTVHLNMQEYLWDGIKRDRLVWMGDMHPEVMAINTVFGYNEVVPKSLDLMRDTTPLPLWMGSISSYSIWWILVHRDWYYYQGDLDYLRQQREYLTDLLRILLTQADEQGVEKMAEGRFLDWPTQENPTAIHAGLQALMVQGMQAGDELCTILGEDSLAQACRTLRLKMIQAAPKVIKPLLKSTLAPEAPGQKQAAALLALSGLMDPKEANQRFLSQGGGRGFSTFYGYYMLRAMAEGGDYEGAMQVIRQFWGAMLDLGATTFWEDFNLDWLPDAAPIDEPVPAGKRDIHGDFGAYCYKGFRHSLCHGWASGPTSWLTEYVLGVKVVEPGCRTLRIEPHLGSLQWAEGCFPTPYGVVKIRHEKQPDGTLHSVVDAPDEIRILQAGK
ncbi:MAG: alpha-L-rhamnosidase C-terminal domain-containing protein [Parabacteroides sp.]